MSKTMENLIEQYVEAVKKIYGSHIRQIILYGSYAREDFRPDSDVDIMILLDMSLHFVHNQQLHKMPYYTCFVMLFLFHFLNPAAIESYDLSG